MHPTDHLRSLTGENWQAATRHGFTDALATGTLPPAKMLEYLRQDYLFIEGFVRLLASAVAHAPTLKDAIPAAQFLGVISGPENTYFLRSITALGGDINAPTAPASVTADFQAIMAQAATSGKYEQMIAVLVVAEWVYLEWATPYSGITHNLPFWFAEWITLHSGPDFESVVNHLRGQLDQIWPTLTNDSRRAVETTFCQAVTLERRFFDAAASGFGPA